MVDRMIPSSAHGVRSNGLSLETNLQASTSLHLVAMSVGGEQRPGELFKFKMARCEFVILLRPETPADNIARGLLAAVQAL